MTTISSAIAAHHNHAISTAAFVSTSTSNAATAGGTNNAMTNTDSSKFPAGRIFFGGNQLCLSPTATSQQNQQCQQRSYNSNRCATSATTRQLLLQSKQQHQTIVQYPHQLYKTTPEVLVTTRSHNKSMTTSTSRHFSSSSNNNESDEISSTRGRNAVKLLPVYLTDARAVTQYHPIDAPDGALQLSVAENQMLEDLLVPNLQMFSSSSSSSLSVEDEVKGYFEANQIYYQPTHGRMELRTAMASYLERILQLTKTSSKLDVEGLVCGAGCNAVLENLCFCLTEPGDGVLLPTPYYAAFEFDLVARAGLNIIPVNTVTHNQSTTTTNNETTNTVPKTAYYPNRTTLNHAYEQALASGTNPKILLLSHPNNPLGICYPPSVMKECIDWARERKVHLVSDEIYAGSVYRTNDDDDGDEDVFQSALSLARSNDQGEARGEEGLGLGPYVHFVYALSKDFALSGLRVGVAYSENKDIRLPMQKLNDLCQISSQTQELVTTMLSAPSSSNNDDEFFTGEFLKESHKRIQSRCDKLQQCLTDANIPYLHANSGLFVWMDLSEFLPPIEDDSNEQGQQESEGSKDRRERELYLELLQTFGLLFTPGRSMRNELPGFFRCVFTAASDEEFNLGLERIGKFVSAKREGS